MIKNGYQPKGGNNQSIVPPEGGTAVLYKCDPNKNILCKKQGCKYNPNSVYPCCEYSSNRAASVDGVPIIIQINGEMM
ncbi:MAG: hypothetical protein GX808_03960 [Syntrophomonadaceae bacterium]|jgi:hypothetical protein|nr:hypothetical protein [Syntrophomonadaceae bacterium]